MTTDAPQEDTQALLAQADGRIDIVAAARRFWPVTKGKHGDTVGNFFKKVIFDCWSDCWLWYGALDHSGYGLTGGRLHRAHQLAWTLFCGPIPPGLKVLHRCDVRNCVNPEHLFTGTQADNVRDMIQKGRKSKDGPKGEKNYNAVLTDETVLTLRKTREQTGLSFRLLAKKFGVSTMTAYRACSGQAWRHL
jgi:HNH endonuclease